MEKLLRFQTNQQRTCQTTIDCGSLKPRKLSNCLAFPEFDKCTVFYLYERNSGDDWKMRDETFKDCQLISRMAQGDYNLYKLDIAMINKQEAACNNSIYTGLTQTTTYVYPGGNSKLAVFKGFVSAADLNSAIKCSINSTETTAFSFVPKEGITYQYEGAKIIKGLSVKEVSKKYRVQLTALSSPKNIKDFLDNLEEGFSKKYGIFIRKRGKILKIYLGQANEQDHKKLVSDINKDEALKKLLAGYGIKPPFTKVVLI